MLSWIFGILLIVSGLVTVLANAFMMSDWETGTFHLERWPTLFWGAPLIALGVAIIW